MVSVAISVGGGTGLHFLIAKDEPGRPLPADVGQVTQPANGTSCRIPLCRQRSGMLHAWSLGRDSLVRLNGRYQAFAAVTSNARYRALACDAHDRVPPYRNRQYVCPLQVIHGKIWKCRESRPGSYIKLQASFSNGSSTSRADCWCTPSSWLGTPTIRMVADCPRYRTLPSYARSAFDMHKVPSFIHNRSEQQAKLLVPALLAFHQEPPKLRNAEK